MFSLNLCVGNCLQLEDGSIGLIDYGSTFRINNNTRRALADIIVSINESSIRGRHRELAGDTYDAANVSRSMRKAGFQTQNETDDATMLEYALYMFDSDSESEKRGFVIPQEYFAQLMATNPLVAFPEPAISLARTSLLFRGMGSAVGKVTSS